MSRPQRYIIRMAVFLVFVTGLILFLIPVLGSAFMANPLLNGIIAGVLLIGIGYIFREVTMLGPEVSWIERYRQQDRTVLSDRLPSLLSPMANMLGDSAGRRVTLTPVSMRTVLDGIAARLDEQRETSRYLIGVLVFLGLLGTFYGLLVTVRSVSDVIGTLSGGGGDASRALSDLKTSLQTPLHGMSTSFSSSLFGLAGSLILGFLDLQAGQAQNRFFNELEEWLSGLTRLGTAPVAAEAGETPVPVYIQALLEQTADSLDNLQRIMTRGEEGRIASQQGLMQLTDRLSLMTEQMRSEQNVLLKLAESQQELRGAMTRFAEAQRPSSTGIDASSRDHLRSLDGQMSQLVAELARGRTEMVQELRSEIRLVARTVAALAEDAQRPS